MKSKKQIIAFIVAIIAITLLFPAHHYGWGTVFETILLCIAFFTASYFLFFQSFIKEFGKEAAQVLFAEQKITIEEQIKLGFRKAISDYQAEKDKSNKFFEINYSKFQEKRFDVILESYSKLAILSMDASHLLDRMDLGRNEEDVERERVQVLYDDFLKFKRFLMLNKLFFEEENFLKLMAKSAEIKTMCDDYHSIMCKIRYFPGERKNDETIQRFGSIMKSLPVQLTEIENELKSMLFPKDYFAYVFEKSGIKSSEEYTDQN